MRCEICGRRFAKAKRRLVLDPKRGILEVCPTCYGSVGTWEELLYAARVSQPGGAYPGLG